MLIVSPECLACVEAVLAVAKRPAPPEVTAQMILECMPEIRVPFIRKYESDGNEPFYRGLKKYQKKYR